MVRFHWHVEDGFGAFIPPGGMAFHKDTGVQHATTEIEIPGQNQLATALITVPPGYLIEGKTKKVGIVIGHGAKAEDWKGELLTELAVALAQAGYLVMRYYCRAKELRRQRLYEKALDVCATSPFARAVQRWVLVGLDAGARTAAVTGCRCRGNIAGYALLSYPLKEPMITAKGVTLPDSSGPLMRLGAPVLFIEAGLSSGCSAADLSPLLAAMSSEDVRHLTLTGLSAAFVAPDAADIQHTTLQALSQALLAFCAATDAEDMSSCSLPALKSADTAVPPAVPAIAAAAANAVALLDEDDVLVYEVEPFGILPEITLPPGKAPPPSAAAAAPAAGGDDEDGAAGNGEGEAAAVAVGAESAPPAQPPGGAEVDTGAAAAAAAPPAADACGVADMVE